MNIRNVPHFLREHGRPELAVSVESRLGDRKDDGPEDRMETEILMGYLIQDGLVPPDPEEFLLSPDFAYLRNLAVIIRDIEEPGITIELDVSDMA